MFTVTPVVGPCLAVMLKIPCASIPVIFCPWKREILICSCVNAPVIVRQSMKMTNDIFFIIICFYDGTLKGNEKLQVWVLFSKKRENEEKHGKNFSDDKLNQTNYILYICSH